MKYWYRTKHYMVEREENLILNPMLSNKKIRNPFKHYEVKKKYNLILNEPLPQRKKFNISSQSDFIIDKKYKEKLNKNNQYIADKKPLTKKIAHKAKSVKHLIKVAIANAVILTTIYFSVNYGPGFYQSIKNYVVARLRPPSVEAPEFNPNTQNKNDKINSDIGNTKEEDKKVDNIKIDEEGMISYDLFKNSNITNTLQMYLGEERPVTPMFVYPSETKDGIKTLSLLCKLGDDEMVKLEYDIVDPLQQQYYNNLFYSQSIKHSDLINTLSNLANDEYLTDMPITSKIITLDGTICSSVSDLCEDVKHDIIDGEFVEHEIYSFKITSLQDNGKIVEKHYEINKADAQKLEDFNENEIESLLTAFKKDASKFELIGDFDLGYNAPTLVLINAARQEKNPQEQIKISENYKDLYDGDLIL